MLNVGQQVWWASTTRYRNDYGYWFEPQGHIVSTGKVIGSDEYTVAISDPRRNCIVFLPPNSVYARPESAESNCRERNLAMFAHQDNAPNGKPYDVLPGAEALEQDTRAI